MSRVPLNLTRNQLAEMAPNARVLRALEDMLHQVNNGIPGEVDGISASADLGVSQSAQALAALDRIAQALEMLATAPAVQHNNSTVTDYIDLPEIGPHLTRERRVQWNRDDGTMDVGLYGGSVLQVGQEIHYYAKNTSGATITNGTPVMFTGAVGASGKLTFGKAVADGSVLADYMMGVATQDIASNAFGYITSFGLVRGFDTTGTPYGEVWADGDLLYFDPATPGTWTNVQPDAPAVDVAVGVVVNAGGGGSGSIFVRMHVSSALSRLQDVFISGGTPANNDILIYDASDLRWENRTPSEARTALGLGSMAIKNIGASGSFLSADAKTVTVVDGIITSIV